MRRLQLLLVCALQRHALLRREEPLSVTGNSAALGGPVADALNFSNPDVPAVPVGSDMQEVAQDLDAAAAKQQVAPPVEGADPTYAPLAGRPVEAKTLGDYQDDVSDAIAGKKDDVVRQGLGPCGCECCMGVHRHDPTPTSNWTCTRVPDYLTSRGDLPTDGVAPPTDFGAASAPAGCRNQPSTSECGAPAHGADSDEPLEPLTYDLFCATHCRPVDDHTTTPCVAFDARTLDAAWHDGTWTDPLAPSLAEISRMDAAALAQAQASALLPEPEGALPGEIAAVHGAEAAVDALSEPVRAAEKARQQATAVFAG